MRENGEDWSSPRDSSEHFGSQITTIPGKGKDKPGLGGKRMKFLFYFPFDRDENGVGQGDLRRSPPSIHPLPILSFYHQERR